MNFESIDFTIKGSIYFVIPLIIIALAYTFFIYKNTIPEIPDLLKAFLILIRTTILVLIILLLFEPVLRFLYIKPIAPVNLIFIDNSSSIIHKDSAEAVNRIGEVMKKISEEAIGENRFYTFGKNTNRIDSDTNLSFSESVTNFEKITSVLKKEKNISSVVILSDGIVNEGSYSYNYFENFSAPIFTIAVGDTVKEKDVFIKDIYFNKFIYKDTPTEIVATIFNNNLSDRKIFVNLYDGNSLLSGKNIVLSKSGINKVKFQYTPQISGEKLLSITVSNIENETTFRNNRRSFLLNIVNNKIKIFLFSGAPSSDLSSLCKSIERNDKYELRKFIDISDKNKYNFNKNSIDSADILLLLDYPSSRTELSEIRTLANLVAEKNIPLLLFISQLTDYNKLNKLKEFLPFNVIQGSDEFLSITPNVVNRNSLLIDNTDSWENLPPIFSRFSEIELTAGCKLEATGKSLNNRITVPLLFSSKIANRRSIVFNGFNFWHWRLSNEAYNMTLFDKLISNSLKWLYANGVKNNITVTTEKKIYASGETVEFIASVYDETLTPRNDAIIEVKLNSDKTSMRLHNNNNGNYSGELNLIKPDTYLYKALIKIPGESPKTITGKFRITKQNLENNSFILNSKYLTFISNITNGKSFSIKSYKGIIDNINSIAKQNQKFKTKEKSFEFVGNQWILILLIFLFAIEWYIRKRKQLL